MENKVLPNGGRLLLVGFDREHLQDWAVNDPRIILWDQKDLPSGRRCPPLPDNVRRAFIGRFVSHAVGGVVLKEARKRRWIVEYGTTGRCRQLLDQLHGKEDKLPQPVEYVQLAPPLKPAASAVKQVKGTLKAWVAEQLSKRSEIGSASAVARELAPLVQAASIKTTSGSLEQVVRMYRKELGLSPTRRIAKAAPSTAPVTAKVAKRGNLIAELESAHVHLTRALELARMMDVGALKRKLVERLMEDL
jgi:hypothetical protein